MAFLLMAMVLSGNVAIASHDACHCEEHGESHGEAGEDCPLCWCAHSPSCLPDVPPPLPTPIIEHSSVHEPVSQPSIEPLFEASPRGPPT